MEDEKIIQLDNEIESLKIKKKELKRIRDKKLRLRSNNSGKSNALIRVSTNFAMEIDHINNKRSENGLDCLSGPKVTELIIKHKKCYRIIKQDIINYNTNLDTDNKDGEFNDK